MTLLRLAIFVVLSVTTIAIHAEPPPQKTGDVGDEGATQTVKEFLQELQEEKTIILKNRMDAMKKLFDLGNLSLDSFLDAERDYLVAQASPFHAERDEIKALRAIFKNRQRLEKYRVSCFKNGACSEEELTQARLQRLDAHIALISKLPPQATIRKRE
ncbi:hypothetical protein Enr13x_43980 [Stieleria neptunia]|uniref:Periplasmic heavy metal sensor n=1 Tax=Stieleria neptunia TaxID=2527979 RepID=A0A518HUK5_9BACT|nr:hypothetical protein [Stieleria neptunia]QDV44532.1 hypothetical protein Enr13x_43980 [Stieleria neptunia]